MLGGLRDTPACGRDRFRKVVQNEVGGEAYGRGGSEGCNRRLFALAGKGKGGMSLAALSFDLGKPAGRPTVLEPLHRRLAVVGFTR